MKDLQEDPPFFDLRVGDLLFGSARAYRHRALPRSHSSSDLPVFLFQRLLVLFHFVGIASEFRQENEREQREGENEEGFVKVSRD